MSNDNHDLPLDSFNDDEASEAELRELYDNEEIEQFLRLFSTNVTEARAPEMLPNLNDRGLDSPNIPFDNNGADGIDRTPDIDPSGTCTPPTSQSNPSLLESAVRVYLVPRLPPPRLPPAPFTIGRLRLATQRLYLAIEPVYIPFLSRMINLATWKDRTISCFYCLIFWTMWYQNMLLPCLLLRIFYSLLRRKLLPYPTLSELQEHRREVSRAADFGKQISGRLSASSSFGVKELWRLFKVYKNKRVTVKPSITPVVADYPSEEVDPGIGIPSQPTDATVLDDAKDSQDAQDLKRLGVHIMNEIADLHERIKNLFMWRRPESSCVYAIALFCLFLVILLLPARYLSKLSYFVGGVLFWHVTPIVLAIPSAERRRLPPAFGDVPTDADYAMELIAKQVTVTAGRSVQPPKVARGGKTHTCAPVHTTTHDPTAPREEQEGSNSYSVDWKKWGQRAAIGKNWVDDGKRFIRGTKPGEAVAHESPPVPLARSEEIGESHTQAYPAQHSSGPGLITLTGSAFLFTPLMSLEPKVIVPLKTIRGIKKAGLLKGLHLHFVTNSGALKDGESGEREEKFSLVGSRDDLFARLVGLGGSEWILG